MVQKLSHSQGITQTLNYIKLCDKFELKGQGHEFHTHLKSLDDQ